MGLAALSDVQNLLPLASALDPVSCSPLSGVKREPWLLPGRSPPPASHLMRPDTQGPRRKVPERPAGSSRTDAAEDLATPCGHLGTPGSPGACGRQGLWEKTLLNTLLTTGGDGLEGSTADGNGQGPGPQPSSWARGPDGAAGTHGLPGGGGKRNKGTCPAWPKPLPPGHPPPPFPCRLSG